MSLSIVHPPGIPIAFPAEILSSVFEHACDDSLCIDNDGALPFQCTIVQVCRLWRDIAFGDTRLWSNITMYITYFDWGHDIPARSIASAIQLFAFATQRAQELPLDLLLRLDASDRDRLPDADPPEAVLKALLATSARWRQFSAYLETPEDTILLQMGQILDRAENLEKLEVFTLPLPKLGMVTKCGPSLRHVACQWAPHLVLPWGQLIHLELKFKIEVQDFHHISDLEACHDLRWLDLELELLETEIAVPNVARVVTLPLVSTFKTNSSDVINMFNLPAVVTLGLRAGAVAPASVDSLIHRSRYIVRTLLMDEVYYEELDHLMKVLPCLASEIKHLKIDMQQHRYPKKIGIITLLNLFANVDIATRMESLCIEYYSMCIPVDLDHILARLCDVIHGRLSCEQPLQRVFLKIHLQGVSWRRRLEGLITASDIPPKLVEWNDACSPVVGIDIEAMPARESERTYKNLLPNPRGAFTLPAELRRVPGEPSLCPSFHWGDSL
ncbi:hypothetical protein CYLTODRAFT_127208 [Cylindrobasidium torrendii FP15055 ss-10]|uniref:Uncharacterized protein n=1 Tax=Cylindrobasidium torrendii FP15055 ss-10 TaxID=1314674 RepID=A0A0D7B0Q5_9AGAR|nr:hypothetical protein CYLTODRAFT_127208 [Cylindrobasidium torrendii FP15055 ss-10]